MTCKDLLLQAKKKIPVLDAEILMSEICELSTSEMIVDGDKVLPADRVEKFINAVQLRAAGKSVSEILGYWWFFGRKFIVTNDVLTPRPETEVLVQRVIDRWNPGQKIIDMGTGSGCIATTLSLELDTAVLACDVSDKALRVAQENSELLSSTVHFRYSDVCDSFTRDDLSGALIVANLPYIPVDDQLEESVLSGDPNLALFSGNDGLDLYRRFFQELPDSVHSVYIEFHPPQKPLLEALIREHFPSAQLSFFPDLNGDVRFGELLISTFCLPSESPKATDHSS